MAKKNRPRTRNIPGAYKIINIPPKPRIRRGKINYSERLKYIRAFTPLKNPTKSKINKAFAKYKDFGKSKVIAAGPSKLKELKKAGFKICPRGVIVPELFDYNGQPVNGDVVIKGGAVVETYKERVDIYYQFHGNQKKRFLKSPDAVISEILRELHLPASRENLSIHLLYGHLIGKTGREQWNSEHIVSGGERYAGRNKKGRRKRKKSAKTRTKEMRQHLTGIRIVTNKARYEKENKSKKRKARRRS